MSKPIRLTDELKKQALEEFMKALDGLKMSDGKVAYNKNFTYKDDDKAQILFTPLAYTKMISLIMSFDSEVAWHGVGKRLRNNENTARFLITDILVYPQTVTGSTVEMDPPAYTKWLIENDEDERFNHIMMQGHSHVNFGTNPSATDLTHQEEILAQLKPNMFYIFMIWNKKLEHTTKIYDLENNILYENKDISYAITDEQFDVAGFVKDANDKVQKKVVKPVTTTPSYGGGYGYSGYNGGYNGGGAKSKNITPAATTTTGNQIKQKGKSDVGSGWKGRGTEDMDDTADDFWNRDRFDT